MFTDQETRQKRESICNSCENKQGVKCGVCGCFLMFLRKVNWANCPQKKW